MNDYSNYYLMKHGRYSTRFRHRLKSVVVSDSDGSPDTFNQFYQNGGRDYEQYRHWLETSPNPPVDCITIKEEPIDMGSSIDTMLSSSIPSVHSQQPLPLPRIASTNPLLKPMRQLPIPKISEHSLPVSRFSPSQLITTTSFKPRSRPPYNYSHLPPVSISPSQLRTTTTPFKPQSRSPSNYSHLPPVPIPPSQLTITTSFKPTSLLPVPVSSSSSTLADWSVTDVGRFIHKHVPEKRFARKFIQQKIDGHTLPLLTEDHLTRVFKMKLGPALHLRTLISNIQN